jgi:hypothetical protein
MKKYDIHLHVTLKQHPKTKEFFMSSAENMLPHLKRLDIQKGIVLSTGEQASPIGATNEDCKQICKLFPDSFNWMCNVDMSSPETLTSRLASCKQQGAIGVGEVMINKPFHDPFLYALFDACETLSLPVLFHMSPQEGLGYGIVDKPGLPFLEEALKNFPKLIFIGHSQPFWHEISGDAKPNPNQRNSWGEGPVTPNGRVITLLEKYPNLYCDLSANSGGCAVMRDTEFGLKFIETFQDRLLFGTDMVNTDMVFPLQTWLENHFQSGTLSSEAYEKIFMKNTEKIFNLERN